MIDPTPTTALPTDWFAKPDTSPDPDFYASPRIVHHIDDAARAAVAQAVLRHVRPGADVLDLMSSWVSHLPPEDKLPLGRVAGHGLNAEELARNPRLDDVLVQDLNADPRLPYPDASFDAVLITVSIQYLTRPAEVLSEVARVLRPGGVLLISFSNRMFATKAVAVWQAADESQRPLVVAAYLRAAGGFAEPTVEHTPARRTWSGPTDPLWTIVAHKLPASADAPFPLSP